MNPILKKTILAAGAAPMLSACITVGPDYEPPALDVNDQWAVEIADQSASGPSSSAENLRYFIACLQTLFLAGDIGAVIAPNLLALSVIAGVLVALVARNTRQRLD